jgi:hypothetical protein
MYTSILYSDVDNTSFAPVSDECKIKYYQIVEVTRKLSKNIEELFPNLPKMHSILNRDEIFN